jgi:hypothetical protein
MRTTSASLKTSAAMPTHSLEGAIAAIRLLKTNQNLPRRARGWKAQASAIGRVKIGTSLLKPARTGWLTSLAVVGLEPIEWLWATPKGEHEDAQLASEIQWRLGVFTGAGGSPGHR